MLPVITICFRSFLQAPSHLQNSVAGKHDQFSFLPVLLELQNRVAGCRMLVLFNWRTGKTKTHILLFTMQHPRHFLTFDINLNEFAVS